MCIYSLTQIWISYMFSMTWFIFYNKSSIFRLRNWFEVYYIKVSVVFRKCIQTRFDQLDIVIILLQDPEKVQKDVKLVFWSCITQLWKIWRPTKVRDFLKCSLQAVNSTLQFLHIQNAITLSCIVNLLFSDSKPGIYQVFWQIQKMFRNAAWNISLWWATRYENWLNSKVFNAEVWFS